MGFRYLFKLINILMLLSVKSIWAASTENAAQASVPSETTAAKEKTAERTFYVMPAALVASHLGFKTPDPAIHYDGMFIHGFPMLHLYSHMDDRTSYPYAYLTAEFKPEETELPEFVTKLPGNIDSIKVVIMSTDWEGKTLYRPHYMLHKQNAATWVQLAIGECDFGDVQLQENPNSQEYSKRLSFSTHKGAKSIVASPGNAHITFKKTMEDGGREIVAARDIENGSFWVVQKISGKQEKTAVFYWLLNNQQLQQELTRLVQLPGQTLKEFLKSIEDEKWGTPSQRLRALLKPLDNT